MNPPECPTSAPAVSSAPPALEQKPKRILVMDDEPSILDLTARMLGTQGYELETAREGKGALTLYRAAWDSGRPFDAVILDLTVPEGMGGFDTFKALKEFDPKLKAIISTGYSHEPVVLNYRTYGIAGIALKPYKVRDLLGAVERVLQGAA
jgi:two-component system cell cycle sensor histidine kinase/response regulator CckA